MRVLFISSQYPPHELGGYEQLCQEAAKGLSARGHQVRILTSRYGVDGPDGQDDGEVARKLHLDFDLDYYRPLDFFIKRPFDERRNRRYLDELIDQFRPDAAMFWGMYALRTTLVAHAERRMPGRVSFYIGSYWPTDPCVHETYWRAPANRGFTEALKRLLRTPALRTLRQERLRSNLRLRNVACCSEYVRAELLTARKCSADARVIYTSSPPEPRRTEAHSAPAPHLRLLYFGRLVPDKGVHTAIEALARLRDAEGVEWPSLTILGDGHPDYVRRLKEMAADRGVDERISFVSKLPREQIAGVLARHDVFLFTSIWPEPFGRTIVEAMAAGLIVIGSDVGGSREIFRHYDSRMLYQPGDADALAGRIRLLITDPNLCRGLAAAGRRLTDERFTHEQFLGGLEDLLFEVAGAGRAEADPVGVESRSVSEPALP